MFIITMFIKKFLHNVFSANSLVPDLGLDCLPLSRYCA